MDSNLCKSAQKDGDMATITAHPLWLCTHHSCFEQRGEWINGKDLAELLVIDALLTAILSQSASCLLTVCSGNSAVAEMVCSRFLGEGNLHTSFR